MKEYTTDQIRNICLAGQRGCGKTSLVDAVAYNTKINNRIYLNHGAKGLVSIRWDGSDEKEHLKVTPA